MAPSKLQEWFPWTTAPVIINGPMIGVACPALASEVSKAGGIGTLLALPPPNHSYCVCMRVFLP